VVLFDEIQKAHPRILDKFLQILDDGVLTSGRGHRVYFSEAFIIFTANLGIYRLEEDGSRLPNVSPSDPFREVQARVRAEIERHFKLTLNRPEILNPIGENILVFDFIRESIAGEIFVVLGSNGQRLLPNIALILSIAEGVRGLTADEALAAESAVVFAKACELGLEGLVSKRQGGLYKTGEAATGRRQ
jgi:ATP-dependent Clp protease ATP-binding subunit ClpA